MNTIKSNKEINYIYKNGRKIKYPFLNLIVYSELNYQIKGNVAFIAGKKYGNAVWRNKNKRRLREIYKKLNINKNDKILLIANKKTMEVSLEEEVNIIKNDKIFNKNT